MAEDKQGREIEQALRRVTRLEIAQFHQHLPELEEKLRAGMLYYVVEWWDDDCLEIDENAHVLFIFRDGSEYDEVLNPQIHNQLASFLATVGIRWEYSFKAEFGSNILYPAAFAGQPYYEKVPQPAKQWWERLFDILTFHSGEQWRRRKDLPWNFRGDA